LNRILVMLVSMATGLCAANLTTKVDVKSGGLRYKSLIGRMDRQEFVKTALGVLSPKEVAFGAVVAYPTAQARLLGGPRDRYDGTYEEWLSFITFYKAAPGNCPEVQEALKIGTDILYRSMDRGCRTEKFLLQGNRDPLSRTIAGTKVDILHLYALAAPVPKIPGRVVMDVYVRAKAGSVTEQLGLAITKEMKPLSGPATDLSVVLRSDVWFLNHPNFPTVFGFWEKPWYIPTKKEFDRNKEVFCATFDPWPVRCDTIEVDPKAVK
jgi:hypothetical protein